MMEQGEIIYNITEASGMDGSPDDAATDGMDSNMLVKSIDIPDRVMIKQEITNADEEIEISQIHEGEGDVQEGIPVSIDDFVDFHNEQVKTLKNEVNYLTRCFQVLYKFKNVYDGIFDEYFRTDIHFKYKNILEDLETDLIGVIGEDEEKYQELLGEINTEMILTDENQLEFAEGTISDEDDNGLPQSTGNFKPNKVVHFSNQFEQLGLKKLPGQVTAPYPECPACGFTARCRSKLDGHLSEHCENPLVVCNKENCEIAFELKNLFRHEKDYHPETDLICEMCNEMFESKSMLVQHYKLHIKKKDKLKCNFPGCTYTDIYQGRLDRHKKFSHNIDISKQFKCEYVGCGRVFKDRPSFYTHSLIHKDRNLVYKHKCTFESCAAVFKRRRNLAAHMYKHDVAKRRFSCNISNCKRTYARERELIRHLATCHKDPDTSAADTTANLSLSMKKEQHESTIEETSMMTDDGDRGDDGNSTDEQSMNTTTASTNKNRTANDSSIDQNNIIYMKNLDEDVGTCVNVVSSCNDENDADNSSASQQQHSMSEHVLEFDTDGEHPNRKVIYLLNKIGDENDSHMEVSQDMSEIVSPNDLLANECELCSIKFDTPDEMMMHLKERHHQYTVRAYRCDFEDCEFATHFRSILGKHKNDVHGGKYKCDVCGKLSKDSGNHNRHRNIHKNVLFRCRYDNCEAVYKSPKAYYVHVLTHSNEQPVYRCDFEGCKYVTYYVNTLNVHKLTHSDVRKFFCPYENCGKGFKRNGDLNKHITHSHKGVKRPQKKRKLNDGSVLSVVYRCTWANCHFTSSDGDELTKHEEEHATNSVAKYNFETTVEEDVIEQHEQQLVDE